MALVIRKSLVVDQHLELVHEEFFDVLSCHFGGFY